MEYGNEGQIYFETGKITEFPGGKKKAVTLSYDDNVRQDKK